MSLIVIWHDKQLPELLKTIFSLDGYEFVALLHQTNSTGYEHQVAKLDDIAGTHFHDDSL